jgi:hypothetical protein
VYNCTCCVKDVGKLAKRAEDERAEYMKVSESTRSNHQCTDFLAGGYVETTTEARFWKVEDCDSCGQHCWLGFIDTSVANCQQPFWRGRMYNVYNETDEENFSCTTRICFACGAEREGLSPGQTETDEEGQSPPLMLTAASAETDEQTLQAHFEREGFVIIHLLDADWTAKMAQAAAKGKDLRGKDMREELMTKIKVQACKLFTSDQKLKPMDLRLGVVDVNDRRIVVDRCRAGNKNNTKAVLLNQEANLKVHVALSSGNLDNVGVVPRSHTNFFRDFSSMNFIRDARPTRVDQL